MTTKHRHIGTVYLKRWPTYVNYWLVLCDVDRIFPWEPDNIAWRDEDTNCKKCRQLIDARRQPPLLGKVGGDWRMR